MINLFRILFLITAAVDCKAAYISENPFIIEVCLLFCVLNLVLFIDSCVDFIADDNVWK